ncbi:MAG TPA: hypothetical protein VKQ72_13675 [Aggregatilineales bacterium]|nr:hypothetical protein [Aggregatilineales bacterium]
MTDVQMVAAPNANWKARSEVQFGIDSDGTAGFFVLLNYASPDQAALDAFKAAYRSPFQDWHLTQIANFLLLSTPDTAQALKTMIASHLTHLLLAPYRAFIPTATPAGKQ